MGASRSGVTPGRGALLVAAAVLVIGLWLWAVLGGWAVRVFCGEFPSQSCLDQLNLFAAASLIPGLLAAALMVVAFTLPALRRRPEWRAQTLAYALIGWALAVGTFILGGLPAI